MPEKIITLDKVYALRQEYLQRINYASNFASVDKNTKIIEIKKRIDEAKALEETTNSGLPDANINHLHKQLDYIVYLSNLAYFFVKNFTTLSYPKLLKGDDKKRLDSLFELIEDTQKLFWNNLETLIQNLSQKDKNVEELIQNEISYLDTTATALLSTFANNVNKILKRVDVKVIKEDARNIHSKFITLIKEYNQRYSENKVNLETTLGHYSPCHENGDAESKSIYFNHNTDDQSRVIIHEKTQESDPANKPWFIRIWHFIKRIWEAIKSIFRHPKKNDGLMMNDTTLSASNLSDNPVLANDDASIAIDMAFINNQKFKTKLSCHGSSSSFFEEERTQPSAVMPVESDFKSNKP